MKFMKIFLAGMILLKLVFMSDYMGKGSLPNFVIEIVADEEGGSEETDNESDQIFHSLAFSWQSIGLSAGEVQSSCVTRNLEDHIREIVPPPPQVQCLA